MIQVRSTPAVHNSAATLRGLQRRSVGTVSAVSRPVQLICTISAAPGHDKPQHPETANRAEAIHDTLAQSGLLKHPGFSLVQPPKLEAAGVIQLQEVLQLVHPAGYLARLQEICSSLQGPTMIDDSSYIAPGSYIACCEVRKTGIATAAALGCAACCCNASTAMQQDTVLASKVTQH
jgi:acetoin utilization deacetylase AcuC-like enzyme